MKTTPASHQHHPKWPFFVTNFALICAILSIAGCADSTATARIPMEASAARPVPTLAAGDEISIAFPGAPELNSKRKIQPDGLVSLPTVGDVPAAGSSIPQLRSRLTALYRPHLRNPDTIIALESAAAGIYLSGEVVRPGKVALDRPMTALEAVMEAGGFSELANTSKVSVIRNEGGVQRRFELNMKDTLSGYGTRPFYLRPYDVVHVRQSIW